MHSAIADNAQDHGARGAARRAGERSQLALPQLFGGLQDYDERFDARARLPDHTMNLAGLALERFGRKEGRHDLAGGGRLQDALGVRRTGLDHDLAAGDARGWVRAELSVDLTAAGNLDDETWLVGDGSTLAPRSTR